MVLRSRVLSHVHGKRSTTQRIQQSASAETHFHHGYAFYFLLFKFSIICESFCTFSSIFCLSAALRGGGGANGADVSELLQPAMNSVGKASATTKISRVAVRKLKFMICFDFVRIRVRVRVEKLPQYDACFEKLNARRIVHSGHWQRRL